MERFTLTSISGGAAAQWQGIRYAANGDTMVTVLPVGWVGDWHENPRPQWIIPLSGRWSVETMDGIRVEMGPGEISFGEDQATRARDGKRGHYSTTVGGEPAVLMLVQIEALSAPPAPCRFR